MMKRSMKVSLIGDGAVGKTSLWSVYATNKFPTNYTPSVLDEFTTRVNVDDKVYTITIWDTAGQEDYDRLRLLTYPNTDVFVLCYSISNRWSFENLTTKWFPEIKSHYPTTPLLLVGTKLDTRATCEDPVSLTEGQHMRKKIGASHFVECSALEKININDVFQEAVKICLGMRKPPSETCCCVTL